MKSNRIALWTLLSICLVLAACGPTQKDIEATIQSGVDQKTAQTALVETQTSVKATQNALATVQAVPPIAPTVPPSPTEAQSDTTAVAECPLYVYQDWGAEVNSFVPEGWMGDYSDITLDDNYKLDAERPSVVQIAYTPKGSEQWAGIYWWNPPGSSFGKRDGGFDLSCATKLTFWARGNKGGEKAEFKVGGIEGTYKDSLQPAKSSGPIVLTNKWVEYTIPLTGEDLSHIIGGFVWVTNKPSNPNGAVIYLDDIKFEE